MTGPDTPTTPEALAAALDAHNRWRRGDDGDEPAPNPTELGRTIDAAAGMLRTLSARVAALEAERAARWHWHDLQAGAALPECDGERIFVGVNVNGYTCTFNGTNGDNCWTDTAEGTEVLMSGLRWWAPYVSPMDAPAERAAVVPADVLTCLRMLTIVGLAYMKDQLDDDEDHPEWGEWAQAMQQHLPTHLDTESKLVADTLAWLAAAPTPTGDAPALPADAGGEG